MLGCWGVSPRVPPNLRRMAIRGGVFGLADGVVVGVDCVLTFGRDPRRSRYDRAVVEERLTVDFSVTVGAVDLGVDAVLRDRGL